MNWPFFWQLPGPRRWLNRMFDELHEGRHLLLGLPATAPDTLGEATAEYCARRDRREFFDLDLEEFDPADRANPSRVVATAWLPALAARGAPTVEALLGPKGGLAPGIYWIVGLTAGLVEPWNRFLQRAARLQAPVAPQRRALIVACIAGRALLQGLPTEVAVTALEWSNAFGATDALIAAMHLVDDTACGRLARALKAQLMSSLAAGDPGLLDELSREDLASLIHPLPVLRRFGTERRGWGPDTQPDRGRGDGSVHAVDGRDVVHSSILALQNRTDAIDALVWAAEVAILFPFLEQVRRRFVYDYWNAWRVPFAPREGRRIERREDLEFGHMFQQARERPLNGRAIANLRRLTEMRNLLAHFQACSAASIAAIEGLE